VGGGTYEDEELRLAAMAYLRTLQLRTGGPIRFADVAQFRFRGERVPLMDRQRGIRKPSFLEAALSFRTVYEKNPERRPYADDRGPDGYQRYKWRGTDPDHSENRALRVAMQRGLPLIWFHGVASGIYWPVFPVWLVDEERSQHQFVVALDHEQFETWGPVGDPITTGLRRAYAERVVRERLHQPVFRAQVLAAYRNRCAMCHLRHSELLDAAHIRADADGGEPTVTNGIAMCKIHHAAFDYDFMGVRPDLRLELRSDMLREIDGPTLQYALQGLHGRMIDLPSRRAARPDRVALEERYERFRSAS
jgi:putative restriction endonuclease